MSQSEKKAVVYLTFILGIADNYSKSFYDEITPLVVKALEAYNVPVDKDGEALVLVNKSEMRIMERVFTEMEKATEGYDPDIATIKLFILEICRDELKVINDSSKVMHWLKIQEFIKADFKKHSYDLQFNEHTDAFMLLSKLKTVMRKFL